MDRYKILIPLETFDNKHYAYFEGVYGVHCTISFGILKIYRKIEAKRTNTKWYDTLAVAVSFFVDNPHWVFVNSVEWEPGKGN